MSKKTHPTTLVQVESEDGNINQLNRNKVQYSSSPTTSGPQQPSHKPFPTGFTAHTYH